MKSRLSNAKTGRRSPMRAAMLFFVGLVAGSFSYRLAALWQRADDSELLSLAKNAESIRSLLATSAGQAGQSLGRSLVGDQTADQSSKDEPSVSQQGIHKSNSSLSTESSGGLGGSNPEGSAAPDLERNKQNDFPKHPINYLTHSDEAIEIFRDCEADPNCYFTYHHVSKTGGTAVEVNMFPKFNQKIVGTCCHMRLLEQFRANTTHYCNQKFTSWQMSKNKFTEVVQTCHDLYPNRRTVVWVTFREPISTFVSMVHQMCNKNIYKRDPHKAKACEICDITPETEPVFLEWAQSIELQIKGAYHTSHYFLENPRIRTVIMEPNDLNEFWESYTNSTFKHSNEEKSSLCSFRPNSALVKRMREAQNVYRHLLAGRHVEQEVLDRNYAFEGFICIRGVCRKTDDNGSTSKNATKTKTK